MNKKTQTWSALPALLSAVISLLILSPAVRAQGGPPMLTDDPDTPEAGMWEVNFLSTMGRSRKGWTFELPVIDLNYGLRSNLQLKFEAPWLVMKEGGEKVKAGPGNSMIGVKWRFLDEERSGFKMSIYPQLEFNNHTHSVARGLADKGTRLFLPIAANKKIGTVEVTSELGYRIIQHEPDELEYGLLFTRRVTKRVELMAELHGSSSRIFSDDELLLNIGSRVRLAKNAVLLISAGSTIVNSGEGPQNIAAFGIQFNFKNRMPRFARNN
jgi:hypothetical protein